MRKFNKPKRAAFLTAGFNYQGWTPVQDKKETGHYQLH